MRFIDERTLDLDFEGIDAPDETFRLTRSNDNSLGIWVYNFDQHFSKRYRSAPGVRAGAGLERLASCFFAARRSELPVGTSYEQLSAEIRSAVAERWAKDHPAGQ